VGIDIAEQRRFYDERWRDFQHANRSRLLRSTAILSAIAEANMNRPRILDLGCGSGWFSSILGMFGPTVGVDLSGQAVAEASRRYPHVEFYQEDFSTWEPTAAGFDVVVSQEVIEHVEAQHRYLELAHSLLGLGGLLVLTTPNPRTFAAMPDEQRDSWPRQPIEKWLQPRELARLLRSAGFTELRITSVILGFGVKGPYRLVNSQRVRRAAARVQLLRPLEQASLSSMLGLHLLVRARKARNAF
jgi:SAM-dependent methyltransferase